MVDLGALSPDLAGLLEPQRRAVAGAPGAYHQEILRSALRQELLLTFIALNTERRGGRPSSDDLATREALGAHARALAAHILPDAPDVEAV